MPAALCASHGTAFHRRGGYPRSQSLRLGLLAKFGGTFAILSGAPLHVRDFYAELRSNRENSNGFRERVSSPWVRTTQSSHLQR